MQLRRLDNEQVMFVASTNWSTNSFMSAPVPDFPVGWAMATVFVNALPSNSKLLNVIAAPPTVFLLTGTTISASGGFQFGFSNTPHAIFTVLASSDVSLPLSNWTALGGLTETSPGQFQFSDPQATNHSQRLYRVRSP